MCQVFKHLRVLSVSQVPMRIDRAPLQRSLEWRLLHPFKTRRTYSILLELALTPTEAYKGITIDLIRSRMGPIGKASV